MKVVVLVKATDSSERGDPPSPELMQAMHAYNQQLVAAGIMQTGDGLKPSAQGCRVRFSGEQRTVVDGPFAETKELVAGFWVWEVESMEHAVEWAKKCPNPMPEDSELEIRPVYSVEDFQDVSPEFAAAEDELRAQLQAKQR